MTIAVCMPTVAKRRAERAALGEALEAVFAWVLVREQHEAETFLDNVVGALTTAAARPVEYVLTIDDDVALCPDFAARLDAVIDEHSPLAMTLYSRSPSDVEDMRHGLTANRARYVHPTALLMRRSVARDFASALRLDPLWDDRPGRAFMRFWRRYAPGQRVLNALPSLVQHRGLPSLLGHTGRRQSLTFREAFGEVTC